MNSTNVSIPEHDRRRRAHRAEERRVDGVRLRLRTHLEVGGRRLGV